jgi:hypothetical protein
VGLERREGSGHGETPLIRMFFLCSHISPADARIFLTCLRHPGLDPGSTFWSLRAPGKPSSAILLEAVDDRPRQGGRAAQSFVSNYERGQRRLDLPGSHPGVPGDGSGAGGVTGAAGLPRHWPEEGTVHLIST